MSSSSSSVPSEGSQVSSSGASSSSRFLGLTPQACTRWPSLRDPLLPRPPEQRPPHPRAIDRHWRKQHRQPVVIAQRRPAVVLERPRGDAKGADEPHDDRRYRERRLPPVAAVCGTSSSARTARDSSRTSSARRAAPARCASSTFNRASSSCRAGDTSGHCASSASSVFTSACTASSAARVWALIDRAPGGRRSRPATTPTPR